MGSGFLLCPSCGHWCHRSSAKVATGPTGEQFDACPKCSEPMRPFKEGERP